ncbi:hypothetical protein OROHE_015831 [Orobanche hederae]
MPPIINSQGDTTSVQQKKEIESRARKKIHLSPPMPSKSTDQAPLVVQPPMKCTLYTLNLNNPVAYGTVFPSNQEGQTIHGVPLQDDCCRVSVEQVVKGAAFLPYEAGDMRTVEDALDSFVAWPKNLIKNTGQVPNPTANEEQRSADQARKKEKRCNPITHSPVTRSKAEANKKQKL